MKIAMVTGSYPPMTCGVGDYTQTLAEGLSEKVEVIVITSAVASTATAGAVEVLPIVSSWRLRRIFEFAKILRQIRPDILHIQYPTQGYGAGLLHYFVPALARLMGITVVQTWHEIYTGSSLRVALLFAWVPGGLIFVRPNFLKKMSMLLRPFMINKAIRFIPNGSTIPASRLSTTAIAELRQQLLGSQKRLVVFFGFLHFQKGVDLIFQIADPKTDKLLIIGSFDPGNNYHQQLSELSQTSDWNGRVEFTGFLDKTLTADYLRAADAALFPMRSGSGPWNTSLHAATKNGCPFVATTESNPVKTENGIFVKINDIAAMRQALNDLTVGARASTQSSPDEWQEIVEAHLELYKALVKN